MAQFWNPKKEYMALEFMTGFLCIQNLKLQNKGIFKTIIKHTTMTHSRIFNVSERSGEDNFFTYDFKEINGLVSGVCQNIIGNFGSNTMIVSMLE